jgi:hypothetical protein
MHYTKGMHTVTRYSDAALAIMAAYRNYLRNGYSRRLARRLAALMVADARSGVYKIARP